MNLSVVVGNPKPNSRTRAVATAVGGQVAGDRGLITRVVYLRGREGRVGFLRTKRDRMGHHLLPQDLGA